MSLWTGLKFVVMVGICFLALHVIEDEEEGVMRQAAASYTYMLLIYRFSHHNQIFATKLQ